MEQKKKNNGNQQWKPCLVDFQAWAYVSTINLEMRIQMKRWKKTTIANTSKFPWVKCYCLGRHESNIIIGHVSLNFTSEVFRNR